MMGVELFVQVFLDSALLSACVFGTLGWQGRLRNCVLAGNLLYAYYPALQDTAQILLPMLLSRWTISFLYYSCF